MRCNLGATVLMIGDHTDTVRLVRMALEFTPYELHIVPTFDEGLVMSGVLKPDLLIMEGGLLGEIDSDRFEGTLMLSSLPCILLRDRSLKLPLDSLASIGFQLFLDKPFTPLRLHHAIDSALKSMLE